MMKYYLIPSVGALTLEEVQRYPHQLALAPVLLKHPETMEILRVARKRWIQDLILDNGAYEQELVSDTTLIEVAYNLRPDIVVLPDLPENPREVSRNRGLAFAQRLVDWWQPYCTMEAPYPPKFMYVPQGIDAPDVLDDYDWALNNLDPDQFVIGMGISYRHWGTDEEARYEQFQEVAMHSRFKAYRFHILGARWGGLRHFGAFDNVTGIDSRKPMSCAYTTTPYPVKPQYRAAHTSARIPDVSTLASNIRSFCHEYNCEEPTDWIDHVTPRPSDDG
jgi:hypothetical protein